MPIRFWEKSLPIQCSRIHPSPGIFTCSTNQEHDGVTKGSRRLIFGCISSLKMEAYVWTRKFCNIK